MASGGIESPDDDIEIESLLNWLEFASWTAIALFPFLYWVNGPAVSTDQYVVRSILVVVAVVSAIGLRSWHWWSNRPATSVATPPERKTEHADQSAGHSGCNEERT